MSATQDSFAAYRNLVSRVYRLSMMLVERSHEKAADAFDGFLDDLAHLVGTAGHPEIRALDEFLERDPPSPQSPPTEESDAHILPISPTVRMVIHEIEPPVHVVKVESPQGSPQESSQEDVGVEGEAEEAEETEEVEIETEEVEGEGEEETKEVEGEAEEETQEVEVEAEEETEETKEVEEAGAEEETEEVEGEAEEETEEVEAEEETEEVEVEAEEETEEVEVEAEEETEEVEEAGAEEETEEEEGSYEPIKIGKAMYFLDTATQNVFAYISDEEAGDYVGKLVNGKLIRGQS